MHFLFLYKLYDNIRLKFSAKYSNFNEFDINAKSLFLCILLYVDKLLLLFFKQCLLGMKLYFPIDKIALKFFVLFLILFYISL